MGSGGGSSGAVDFPKHIKDTHHLYLHGTTTSGSYVIPTTSLGDVVNAALAVNGNPYQDIDYTDPASDLAAIQDQYDAVYELVDELDPKEDWTEALQRAAEEVRMCGRLKDISATSLMHMTKSQVRSVIEESREDNASDIDELVDWPALAQAVHDKFVALGLDEDLDVASLIEDAMEQATSGLEAAVSTVLQMLDEGILDDLISGYADDISIQKAKTINSFSGHLSAANAVHSSAYLIGLGLIETQYMNNINRFGAELRLQFVQSSMNAHGQLIGNVFQSAARLTNDLGRSKTQNLLNGVNSMVQIMSTKVDHESRLLNLHSQVFLGSLQTALQAASLEKQNHDALLTEGTKSIIQQQAAKIAAGMDATMKLSEVKRLKLLATSEHEAAELDLNEKYALWDFLVFEKAGNILSAPSGMSSPLPPKQSRASSVLSGVIGGAAAGGIGGAIVGGIGGLLS